MWTFEALGICSDFRIRLMHSVVASSCTFVDLLVFCRIFILCVIFVQLVQPCFQNEFYVNIKVVKLCACLTLFVVEIFVCQFIMVQFFEFIDFDTSFIQYPVTIQFMQNFLHVFRENVFMLVCEGILLCHTVLYDVVYQQMSNRISV